MSESLSNTKAGNVVIIGKPNAGKSTLLNQFLNFNLSIVTDKPQTTRKNVIGIYTEDNTQIIFVDTPGVLNPKYEMQRSMMRFLGEALEGADAILVLIDLSDFKELETYFPEELLAKLKNSELPIVIALNKIDTLLDVKNVLPISKVLMETGIFDSVVPICAKSGENIKNILKALKEKLPESPFLYDEDLLSVQNQRFFVSEIIRKQVFQLFKQEIPYSTEVAIIEFKERGEGKWYISAEIIVERDTQKAMIIGKGGASLKNIGTKARTEIEEYLEMPIFLEIFVKVRANWRKDKSFLKFHGY